MPTRYLKPGIRDSELIEGLSPMAEVLFYRLLVTVDDFGRYDARPAMIKSQCFPIKEDVSAKKCDELLRELSGSGLVIVYTSEGKPVLQIAKWDNKPRATESKFPELSDGCMQVYADARGALANVPLTVTVTVTKTDNRKPEADASPPDGFESVYQAYPKKVGKPAALKAWKTAKVKPEEVELILKDIEFRKAGRDWQKDDGQYVPNPSTYFNQRRWEDSPPPSELVGGLIPGAI